ncbi:MAG: efflux RND transporter periplasmic adaptor subunit, partial [Planctomycetales bacterium]|nr:efflux RND transporter periplasmic adaptor subunit [Planctomycetales bacterium]
DGDFPQLQRQAESDITLAEEELKRANERIRHSSELKELGYISEGQVDADRLMLLRIQVALETAKQKFELLEQFTHVRMLQELESKVEEATRTLARSRERSKTVIEQAETKLAAQQATEDLEVTRLNHLAEQIEKCTVRAPQDGSILYPLAADEEEPPPVKHGAIVHQRQHLFTLPSTDSMLVRASVHEAVVHLIKTEQTATIEIDALPGVELTGHTQEISTLPDLQNWRKSTVNFYATKILIDQSNVASLRPGMNAKVEIAIETVPDVILIPVHAVQRDDDKSYAAVWNPVKRREEKRLLELGATNDDFVEVRSGLNAGELVILGRE